MTPLNPSSQVLGGVGSMSSVRRGKVDPNVVTEVRKSFSQQGHAGSHLHVGSMRGCLLSCEAWNSPGPAFISYCIDKANDEH